MCMSPATGRGQGYGGRAAACTCRSMAARLPSCCCRRSRQQQHKMHAHAHERCTHFPGCSITAWSPLRSRWSGGGFMQHRPLSELCSPSTMPSARQLGGCRGRGRAGRTWQARRPEGVSGLAMQLGHSVRLSAWPGLRPQQTIIAAVSRSRAPGKRKCRSRNVALRHSSGSGSRMPWPGPAASSSMWVHTLTIGCWSRRAYLHGAVMGQGG